MTYKGGASWRTFRYVKQFYVFGAGQDKATFFDSSDIYLKITARVPRTGTAWIVARSTMSLGGGTVDGYRLELTRDAGGQYTVTARAFTPTDQRSISRGRCPHRWTIPSPIGSRC